MAERGDMEAVKACLMARLLDWTRYQRLALTVVSKYNTQSKKPGRYGAVDVCVCVGRVWWQC